MGQKGSQSKSSKNWLKEHFADEYVKLSQKHGYRSRAAYKLIEIQKKDKLIKPAQVIIDLGAAPGSWSQVALEYLKEKGEIIALDILPMDSLAGVQCIQGDFTEQTVLDELLETLDGKTIDLVLSDIAPNISGIASSDQAKSIYLAELALGFCQKVLKKNGNFLVKVFQGEGFDDYLKQMRSQFSKVIVRKPKASRPRSREVYLLGRGIK